MKITVEDACLALLPLLACRSADSTGPGAPPAPLLRTEWVLTSIASGAVPGNLLELDEPPTLRLETKGDTVQVSGFSGVNRFTGGCTLEPAEQLTFSPLITTRMAGPPERMKLESVLLEHLQGAHFYAISGTELSIFTELGRLGFRAK